jgi:hypothetical protein
MNYKKIYEQIIEKAKADIRKKSIEIYYESHHIIPKCMGGTNEHSNLVLLTGREHFICHWLLARLYPENVSITAAFWGMCNQRKQSVNRYITNSKTYQESKELHAKNLKILRTGIIMTAETKQKLSDANKGQIPWNKGIKYTGDRLESVRLHFKDPLRCSKISKSMKGKKKSIEHVSKLIGKKREIVLCPHCDKAGGINNMYRYHFDNCKFINLASSFKK